MTAALCLERDVFVDVTVTGCRMLDVHSNWTLNIHMHHDHHMHHHDDASSDDS